MKKFTKLLIVLLSILILEVILIYLGYMKSKAADTMKKIDNYDAKKPIVIMIDVSSNIMSVMQEDKIIKIYDIAGGKFSTPSPIGTWTIINKGKWTGGFGGYFMGINVPWGTYGIHGTVYPSSIGRNSSHGCIRMKNEDVEELYKITPIGTKVIINGGAFGNFGSGIRRIKPGDRGNDVLEIQKLLQKKGYYKINPNGIYGKYMEESVHKFQKDNKLQIENDLGSSFYNKLGIKLID